jgi:carboxylesterase type B
VKTEQGKAQGKTINDGKVKAFLGLPYAAPPVGDLRWKAPQPPPSGRARAMRPNSARIAPRAMSLTT